MTGRAESSIERCPVRGELARPEALGANAVSGPESFVKIVPAQRHHIKSQLVDLLFAQSELGHCRSAHYRSGRAKMLFKPVGECALTVDRAEVELSGILVALGGQIRPVVASHAANFVTAATTERMK